ncbi:MAG: hypothetical protein ABI156_15785 [Caldimonas sp.]
MNAATASDARSGTERQPLPSPHRSRVGRVSTWFGLLGAATAWSLQVLFNVGLAGYACYPHDVPLAEPLWSGMPATTLWIEVAAIVISTAAGLVAFTNWRRSRGERPGGASELVGNGDGRTRFMAMAGMMVSGLFLLANVITLLYIVWVAPCGG